MIVRNFLVLEFFEIVDMGTNLPQSYGFRREFWTKKREIGKTKIEEIDLIWDLRANRQGQNDRTLILLL